MELGVPAQDGGEKGLSSKEAIPHTSLNMLFGCASPPNPANSIALFLSFQKFDLQSEIMFTPLYTPHKHT
jgi:hypothetical protein